MRNETVLDALVSELQHNCGDMLAAARTVGVSLMFVNQWAKDDKITKDRLTEAAAVGTQGLVSAAIQRAVHGVEEDVYYKGEVCGTKTNYSDSLLTTLLKAKVQEFKSEDAQPMVQVNIANLMPRATSYDQWLAMKDSTLNKALPAPDSDDVIEAEYVEVQPVSVFSGIDL